MWSFMMLLLITLGRADKLDRLYLPPPNAENAGGLPGDIEAPFESTILSQPFDHSKYPENPLSAFESDKIPSSMDQIIGIDSSYPNIPVTNIDSTYNIPSTTDVTYGQTDEKLKPINKQYANQPNYPSETNLGKTFDQQYPERVQAEADRNAVILNFDKIINPTDYAYSFDTSNGIHADENSTTIDGSKAKGSYSYIGDDGKNYTVYYTADENGFQPRGDHLPTPPPIPDAIKKVIEQIADNERNGIFNDGSYDDNKYGYKNYHNLGRGNELKGNKYTNPTNIPKMKENSLVMTKHSETPSQSVQKGVPIVKEEPVTDNLNNDYDTDNDFKNDGDNFRRYMKPINDNIQEQDKVNKIKNNIFDHQSNTIKNSQPTNGNDYFAKMFLLDKNNVMPSNSINQDNNIPAELNKFLELENLKDVPNSRKYSSLAPVIQSGYQYYTPQIRFISQTNGLPSRNSNYDKQSTPKLLTLPVLQNNEHKDQKLKQSDRSQPINYDKQEIYPMVINKSQPSSVENDDNFIDNPEKYIGETDSLIPSRNHEINESVKLITGMVNTKKIAPVANIKYNNPQGDLQFGQKQNNMPSPISNFSSRYYSTTPEPSQFSTNSEIYRPREEFRTPGTNIGFSTTRPRLFTNGPYNTETEIKHILPSTSPILSNKIKENINHNQFDNVSQNTDVPLATELEEEQMRNYFQPQYTSTTTRYGTPEYNLQQIYHPSHGNVFKLQPSTKSGEDFSGPKQLQRYDPLTGYHYK